MPIQQILLGVGGKEKVYLEDIFAIDGYVGEGSTGQNIVNGIDLATKGGLVWLKRHDAGSEHKIFDTERGAGKELTFDDDDAEQSLTAADTFTSFNSNGFTVGDNSDYGANNDHMVAYTFAKQEGFFDVVNYTGNNSGSPRAIPHNLGCKPGLILLKKRSDTTSWYCWHSAITATDGYLSIQNMDSQQTGQTSEPSWWGDTEPTTTHFTIGGYSNNNNQNYIVYLFAEGSDSGSQIFGDSGNKPVIKCGEYTGNGNSSGPEIDLGFTPQLLLIKSITTNGGWLLHDDLRGMYFHNSLSDSDTRQPRWFPVHAKGATLDSNSGFTLLHDSSKNGFKLRATDSDRNQNNIKYAYMAISRPDTNVGKIPSAGTEVFAMDEGANVNEPRAGYDAPFRPDTIWIKRPASGGSWYLGHRGQEHGYLYSNETGGENYDAEFQNNIHSRQYGAHNYGDTYFGWMLKRAPKFYDTVFYRGSGGNETKQHQLGAVPEMMIFKRRNGTSAWWTYHKSLNGGTNAAQYGLQWDADNAKEDQSWFQDTTPTASTFSVSSVLADSGDDYIAMLFASLDGVCHIGGYQGTSPIANRVITTGFQPRLVMIKNGDTQEDWVLFDSERGWDTRLRPNRTNSQSTGTYLSVQSTGFTVTNQSSTALNSDNDDNFVYIAIA